PVAEVRPARGTEGAGARPPHAVRGAWRLPAGAGPHGGGRRRRPAPRLRGAEGEAGGGRPVRSRTQARAAAVDTTPGGDHLAHRRGRARRAERAVPTLPAA